MADAVMAGARASRGCPLCGRQAGRELYRHRGRIVRCIGCGLVRQDPIPLPSELLDIYRADDYFRLRAPGGIGYGDYYADEPVYRPYFRRKIQQLGRFRRPPGRLLEVGAAAGYALDEARHAGWHVSGVELSPEAVRHARERLRLDVAEGAVEDISTLERHDVILAFQTIEHVVDVRRALARMRAALVPGGVLMLTTPDHGSWVRRLSRRFWLSYRPEHLVYFDRRSIRALLEQERFSVELVGADDPLLVPMSRLMERAAHFYRPGLASRLDAGRLPRWRLPVWLGDMVVIARAA